METVMVLQAELLKVEAASMVKTKELEAQVAALAASLTAKDEELAAALAGVEASDAAAAEVESDTYCMPRHPTHFEPSLFTSTSRYDVASICCRAIHWGGR